MKKKATKIIYAQKWCFMGEWIFDVSTRVQFMSHIKQISLYVVCLNFGSVKCEQLNKFYLCVFYLFIIFKKKTK